MLSLSNDTKKLHADKFPSIREGKSLYLVQGLYFFMCLKSNKSILNCQRFAPMLVLLSTSNGNYSHLQQYFEELLRCIILIGFRIFVTCSGCKTEVVPNVQRLRKCSFAKDKQTAVSVVCLFPESAWIGSFRLRACSIQKLNHKYDKSGKNNKTTLINASDNVQLHLYSPAAWCK